MKTPDDYPYIMTAIDLAKFLQVSPPTAYERLRTDLKHIAFPLNGSATKSNIRVYRDDVIAHYKSQIRQGVQQGA
ncbi:MAG: hypothetical protein K0Q73_7196 [Paenibacillus sp.]|jgi:hypothetical protein|nr:hypothetical protein [Paenibacillus sp.]